MNNIVRNFLIKVLNKIDAEDESKFIDSLLPYLNIDTARLIWRVRQEKLTPLSDKKPSIGKDKPSSGMIVLSSKVKKKSQVSKGAEDTKSSLSLKKGKELYHQTKS